MKRKLDEFVNEYRDVYKFDNYNILFDLIDEIQNIIDFTFSVEISKEQIMPQLKLGEPDDEIDSSKTQEYKKPLLFINLQKRKSVGMTGNSNDVKYKTFHNNLVAGVPKFAREIELADKRKVQKAVMYYDNQFTLTLITKTVKEAMEFIPLIERGLNINSRAIMPNFIEVSGITNIETIERKENDKTVRTKITYEVRSREELIIDNSYILVGYQIHNGDVEFKSGSIQNGTWIENQEDGEFEKFPE